MPQDPSSEKNDSQKENEGLAIIFGVTKYRTCTIWAQVHTSN